MVSPAFGEDPGVPLATIRQTGIPVCDPHSMGTPHFMLLASGIYISGGLIGLVLLIVIIVLILR
jgi:hypothetical protein